MATEVGQLEVKTFEPIVVHSLSPRWSTSGVQTEVSIGRCVRRLDVDVEHLPGIRADRSGW